MFLLKYCSIFSRNVDSRLCSLKVMKTVQVEINDDLIGKGLKCFMGELIVLGRDEIIRHQKL